MKSQEVARSDEELVREVQGGDRSAFDILVQRYRNPITAFLQGVVNDRERALELSQETFLRVYLNIHRFEPDSKFTTWMYRIGMNLAIDEIRRRKRWRWVPFTTTTQDGEVIEREQPSTDPGPERHVLGAETQRIVRRAISTLPERYREALVLRDLQGLTYDEIAAIQRVPEGTVKSRINRARLMLKDRLTPFIEGRGLPASGSPAADLPPGHPEEPGLPEP